jgi:hypothetical protein
MAPVLTAVTAVSRPRWLRAETGGAGTTLSRMPSPAWQSDLTRFQIFKHTANKRKKKKKRRLNRAIPRREDV